MNPSTESTQLSTLPRRYTLAEIDEMRELIHHTLTIQVGSYHPDQMEKRVEARLRTCLLAGIDPQELRDKLTEAEKEFKPFWKPVSHETIQTPL